MENTQEGPSTIEIHSYSKRQQVCGDCKYHRKRRWMCGHESVTDNYSCTHPDFSIGPYAGFMGEGRSIAFDSEETPSTPSWCPVLKDSQ